MKITILGAQGTGKTQLANDLSRRLRSLHDITSTITDNPPLMVAVYADLRHDDLTPYQSALIQHRTYDLTLVTGLDIPIERNGQHAQERLSREAVDARLRMVLTRDEFAYTVIYGLGLVRVEAALNAIAPLRHDQAKPTAAFSNHWQWSCEKCSDPECEHRMFTGQLKIGRRQRC